MVFSFEKTLHLRFAAELDALKIDLKLKKTELNFRNLFKLRFESFAVQIPPFIDLQEK